MKFGEMAILLGFATAEQVEECLRIQNALLHEREDSNLLGAVLCSKRYMNLEQVQRIMDALDVPKETRWSIPGYAIEGTIGQGQMGWVYRGRHLALNRAVAVKVLPPQLAHNEEYVRRFFREARTAAKLNHPGIIQALDAGAYRGYYYFVMEYVEGLSLEKVIEREKNVPQGTVIRIAISITGALDHAFQEGIVHRDVKPGNILITPDGTAKLCDLGLAKERMRKETEGLTPYGMVLGTPYYIAPEAAIHGEQDIRSDLYSLGATLYHALAGEPPFPGESMREVLEKVLQQTPLNLASRVKDISPGLARTVHKLLDKRPENRYPTPADLLRELEALKVAHEQSRKGSTRRWLRGLFGR